MKYKEAILLNVKEQQIMLAALKAYKVYFDAKENPNAQEKRAVGRRITQMIWTLEDGPKDDDR